MPEAKVIVSFALKVQAEFCLLDGYITFLVRKGRQPSFSAVIMVDDKSSYAVNIDGGSNNVKF